MNFEIVFFNYIELSEVPPHFREFFILIMKKDSFVIYTEKEVFLRHLNDAQKARILEAFFAYADERELPEMDNVTSIIWEVFSLDFDRNNEKYERIKKARSEAGKQHRGNQYCSDKMEQMEQNGTNGTNGTDNVNVDVNVNDNVNDSLFNERMENASAERERIFEEVFLNFFENNVKNPEKEAERLINHYESQGWKKAGGAKITSLRAICNMWKPEDSATRFAPEINDFVQKTFQIFQNNKEKIVFARFLKDIQIRGENCIIICDKPFEEFIENHIDAIKPIYQQYIGNKNLNYKIIK